MFQTHPVQNDSPMLVTTVTRGRKKIFNNPVFARQAVETLYKVQEIYPFFLFGFVIMPDHIHFLLHAMAPLEIGKIMKSYKIGVGYDTGLGPIWQSRFHILFPKDSGKALHYIHLNPVRDRLSELPEKYPWSSASGMWDVTALEYWW